MGPGGLLMILYSTTCRFDHRDAPLGWFRLRIYDNRESINRAVRPLYEIEAVFHRRTKLLPNRYVGTMMVPIDVRYSTMVHECVHAAVALYGQRFGQVVFPLPKPGHSTSEEHAQDREEDFAYIMGSVTTVVANVIESMPEFQGWPTVE